MSSSLQKDVAQEKKTTEQCSIATNIFEGDIQIFGDPHLGVGDSIASKGESH